MKILVINLLRLGDMIMSVPVLNGLRKSRPDAEIHVLSFKQVASLHPMLPQVRKWWTIDRDELQDGLGRADVPLLTSFALLQERLDEVNGENYDLIINLTQTHFSAWIAGYLKAPDRLGLTYDLKGLPHFYSPWFRYLDKHADESVEDVFHHSDIFRHACGLGTEEPEWFMKVTDRGRHEIAALEVKSAQENIVLQLYTSDEKKNWSEEQWAAMVKMLAEQRPHARFFALGAPNEEEKLRAFIASTGVPVKPAILSMEGALALLDSSSLLITGDTSIKHLANASHTKILELSLGWSDWRRTGAYKAGSLILRGENSKIGSVTVAHAADLLLSSNWIGLKELSRAVAPELKIHLAHELNAGFWFATELSIADTQKNVDHVVARVAWKLALNSGRDTGYPQFGSEGVNLRRELSGLFADPALPKHLDFLEEQECAKQKQIQSELLELKRGRPAGAGLPEIAQFRKRQIELESAFQHHEYKTKLIRTVKSHWTESL